MSDRVVKGIEEEGAVSVKLRKYSLWSPRKVSVAGRRSTGKEDGVGFEPGNS